MMHRIWAVLRFLGRWLGPALLLLAVYFHFYPVIPFADGTTGPALAGALVTAIACLFMRAPERRRQRIVFAAVATLAFVYGGWRLWEDSAGFRTQQLVFENRGARLAATLYLPDRPGKAPGIVWIHGSGPQTRGLVFPYSRYLARQGYAVLVFDKRGVGESTGRYGGGTPREICPENFDLLASDGAAALAVLAKRPEVRADRIGFVGVSQGGWITPRAAMLSGGKVAFMLLISAPTNSAQEIVRLERLRIGEPKGFDLAAVMAAFRPGGRDVPAGMNVDQAFAYAQTRPSHFPCPDFDPRPDLRALDIPAFWLLGDSDWIVPSRTTEQNIDALRKLGKPYEYRNIPGAGHAMLFAPKAMVLETIETWLSKVTR